MSQLLAEVMQCSYFCVAELDDDAYDCLFTALFKLLRGLAKSRLETSFQFSFDASIHHVSKYCMLTKHALSVFYFPMYPRSLLRPIFLARARPDRTHPFPQAHQEVQGAISLFLLIDHSLF